MIDNPAFIIMDKIAGKLALPVFLVHLIAIWIVGDRFPRLAAAPAAALLLTLILSIPVACFQQCIDTLRYRYRGFGPVAKEATNSSVGSVIPA